MLPADRTFDIRVPFFVESEVEHCAAPLAGRWSLQEVVDVLVVNLHIGDPD